MIVERLLGHRSELTPHELDQLTEDRVPLANDERVKRVQRVRTESGREIGLRLDGVRELRDGDILHRTDTELVTVRVLPTDVLVIAPGTTEEMGKVAHGLGNRHLQAQFFGPDSDYGRAVMVVQYDHTVEDFLTAEGTQYTREDRVLPVAFRHAEHSH